MNVSFQIVRDGFPRTPAASRDCTAAQRGAVAAGSLIGRFSPFRPVAISSWRYRTRFLPTTKLNPRRHTSPRSAGDSFGTSGAGDVA